MPKKQDEGACHARRYTRTTRPPRSCQVVGDTTVVAAFLRVVKDKDKPKKPQERILLISGGHEEVQVLRLHVYRSSSSS